MPTQLHFPFYIPRPERPNYARVRRFINDIDCINAGGCGIAALAFYRWRKAHGLRADGFAFLYDDRWELDNNREALESNNLDRLKVPAHVALIVGNKLYDSEGSQARLTCEYLDYIQRGITENILVYMLNQTDGWNDLFDQSYYIPQIQAELGVDLSDIDY